MAPGGAGKARSIFVRKTLLIVSSAVSLGIVLAVRKYRGAFYQISAIWSALSPLRMRDLAKREFGIVPTESGQYRIFIMKRREDCFRMGERKS